MKYLVDNVFVGESDGQGAIRKAVASALGVSPTHLRFKIVRRAWQKTNKGGKIRLCVEAETNEFVRNTSYFYKVAESSPLVAYDTTFKERPLVVGQGLLGLLCAASLASMGLKPMVVGSSSANYGEEQTGLRLCLSELSPQALALLGDCGVSFSSVDAYQTILPSELIKIEEKLKDYVTRRGGEIWASAVYEKPKRRFGKLKGAICRVNGESVLIKCAFILLADRSHDDEFFVGCAIESSLSSFNLDIYGKKNLFLGAPPYYVEGHVVDKGGFSFLYQSPFLKSSPTRIRDSFSPYGVSFGTSGKNAVSYLGVKVSSSLMEQVKQNISSLSKPGSVPYSSIADFLEGKAPLRLGKIKPFDVKKVELFSFRELFGSTVSPLLEKVFRRLSKGLPYLVDGESLLGGVICMSGRAKSAPSLVEKGVYCPSIPAGKSTDFGFLSSICFSTCLQICAGALKRID